LAIIMIIPQMFMLLIKQLFIKLLFLRPLVTTQLKFMLFTKMLFLNSLVLIKLKFMLFTKKLTPNLMVIIQQKFMLFLMLLILRPLVIIMVIQLKFMLIYKVSIVWKVGISCKWWFHYMSFNFSCWDHFMDHEFQSHPWNIIQHTHNETLEQSSCFTLPYVTFMTRLPLLDS